MCSINAGTLFLQYKCGNPVFAENICGKVHVCDVCSKLDPKDRKRFAPILQTHKSLAYRGRNVDPTLAKRILRGVFRGGVNGGVAVASP